ncbi:MAG: ATP-grasp domain-containing protein [Phycisphaerae bacterium]
MTPSPPSGHGVTILLTCAGRRVELLQAFRAAGRALGVTLRVLAADTTASAPALSCADAGFVVPPVSDAACVPALLDLVRREGVHALVPTIDTELALLSREQAAFAALGCRTLIGTPDVIDICRDKLETYRFLRQNGIDTPMTWTPAEVRGLAAHTFPYFVKPRFGSASDATHKIEDDADLAYFLSKGRDPIVQEFVGGVEHTLDAYVGLTGRPACVVPRRRLQVRGGEVSKGVVVKDFALMEAGRRVVERLGDSLRGLVTIQCIVTPAGAIRFIEINPRFGGGAPLSIAAGADFPRWLIQELLGDAPTIAFDGFEHGLCMLRYDWSVFVPSGSDLQPRLARPLRPPPAFE